MKRTIFLPLVGLAFLACPSAVNLACAPVSAKIVQLLRRVAGVRQSLTIESRLRRVPMVLRGRTAPGDPIRPTYLSGGRSAIRGGRMQSGRTIRIHAPA